MKVKQNVVCLLLLIFYTQVVTAQQWIDKQYQYDSLLNVQYGNAIDFAGNAVTLSMDIYLPKCEDSTHIGERPLMIWVHGGAFLSGSKDDNSIQQLCKAFAQRGYVTASIGYRLGFVADDNQWQCNFPNYSCLFAADSSEWGRAYYRAIQDVKGGLRFLVNRKEAYKIDPQNIFISGESAGAFTALGVALMDSAIERPSYTFALSEVPKPHSGTLNCDYNQGINFGNTVSRPDLGDIEGNIEPSSQQYTIKGVGNMYGGMMSNLFQYIPNGKLKPSIYSFHQPCDLIVPIDSNFVMWGLSWCFTNGYNCYGLANNKLKIYGSRAFSHLNTANGYGYNIHNEFTATNFPYSFLLGVASCVDQASNPCHAYDNKSLREGNLAAFFAPLITSGIPCDSNLSIEPKSDFVAPEVSIFPNPAKHYFEISTTNAALIKGLSIYNMLGQLVYETKIDNRARIQVKSESFNAGVYLVKVKMQQNQVISLKLVKE